MGQPQMHFSTQGFPPGVGGALPASTAMPGETLPNGGYMGMQQQQQQGPGAAHQGQTPYSLQQGQWSMNQVTLETCSS